MEKFNPSLPRRNEKRPTRADVIDLGGKFVMPGIITLHGHLGATVDLQQGPQLYSKENIERDLRTYASYGVTTVVSLGTDLDPVFAVRDSQRGGRPHMARVYTAGKRIHIKGRRILPRAGCVMKSPHLRSAKRESPSSPPRRWISSRSGSTTRSESVRKCRIELSRAIIASAKHHGPTNRGPYRESSGREGRDRCRRRRDRAQRRDQEVDQAFVDLMKKRQAWQMAPTLTREISTYIYAESPKFLDDPFFTRSVSAKVIDSIRSPQYVNRIKSDPELPRYHGLLTMAEKNLKLLSDAGVKYGFGTDSGPPARCPGLLRAVGNGADARRRAHSDASNRSRYKKFGGVSRRGAISARWSAGNGPIWWFFRRIRWTISEHEIHRIRLHRRNECKLKRWSAVWLPASGGVGCRPSVPAPGTSAPRFAIFMIDPDGIITTWNAGVLGNLGYNEEEFIGMSVVEHFRAGGYCERGCGARARGCDPRWLLA